MLCNCLKILSACTVCCASRKVLVCENHTSEIDTNARYNTHIYHHCWQFCFSSWIIDNFIDYANYNTFHCICLKVKDKPRNQLLNKVSVFHYNSFALLISFYREFEWVNIQPMHLSLRVLIFAIKKAHLREVCLQMLIIVGK